MRPAFNLEPKYRVTMLTREDWTSGSGPSPEIKGLVCYTDGSRMKDGTGAGVYGHSLKRRLSFSLGKYPTVFQAEIYAIFACAYNLQSLNRPEKYICICSDSQAALKAHEAVKTTSSLVHQCQKPLKTFPLGMWWSSIGTRSCRSTRLRDHWWDREEWLCSEFSWTRGRSGSL